MKINFTPRKMIYTAVATAALAGSALVGGGAAIRYQNEPHDTVQIDLSGFKNMIEKEMRHLKGEYTHMELAEKHVDDLESILNELKRYSPESSFENYMRNRRDESVNKQKELDLAKADNAIERTAIKAYAMAILGVNHAGDAIEDLCK